MLLAKPGGSNQRAGGTAMYITMDTSSSAPDGSRAWKSPAVRLRRQQDNPACQAIGKGQSEGKHTLSKIE
eukprot:767937-Hanusia_phi.AAC.1